MRALIDVEPPRSPSRFCLSVQVILAALLLPPMADAQVETEIVYEFEAVGELGNTGSTQGWTAHPAASFPSGGWPTYGDNLSGDRVKPPGFVLHTPTDSSPVEDLQGDYNVVPVPIGISGEYFLGSHEARESPSDEWGNARTWRGSFVSPWFPFGGTKEKRRFLSFLIGGNDLAAVSVSLMFQPGCVDRPLPAPPCVPGYGFSIPVFELADVSNASSGQLLDPAIARPVEHPTELGTGDSRMRLVVWDTWSLGVCLWADPFAIGYLPPDGCIDGPGRASWPEGLLQVTVTDGTDAAWINVDRFQLSAFADVAEAPMGATNAPEPESLFGLADLHTHWMTHMSFGSVPRDLRNPDSYRSASAFDTTSPPFWAAPYAADSESLSRKDRWHASMPMCDHDRHDDDAMARTHGAVSNLAYKS